MLSPKALLSIIASALIVISFSSCGDNSLAKNINGTWKGTITTKYDDQSTENEDIYIKFTYVESDEKDGGEYIEVRESNVKDIDLDDEKINVKCRTYIRGTWEVAFGDLYMKPDVSSLKVSIRPEDVKISYNNVWTALDDLDSMLGSLGYSRQELVSDLQKDLYTEMFHEYKSDADNSDDQPFPDLKVNGESMTFTSEDVGTATFQRVNIDVNNIFRNGL